MTDAMAAASCITGGTYIARHGSPRMKLLNSHFSSEISVNYNSAFFTKKKLREAISLQSEACKTTHSISKLHFSPGHINGNSFKYLHNIHVLSQETETNAVNEGEDVVFEGNEEKENENSAPAAAWEDDAKQILGEDSSSLDEEARKFALNYKKSLLQGMPIEEEEEEEEKGKKGKKKKGRGKNTLQYTSQIPDHLLPKIAIVGRPNVGKSALFNRIAGRDLAIVQDEPGVTRDRQYTRAFWTTNEFLITDTGGVLTPPTGSGARRDAVAVTRPGGELAVAEALKDASLAGLPALIERQAAAAVEEAEAVLFVVDGQAGVTAADEEIANWLRKKYSGRKTIVLAVNKCESPTKGLTQASQFWALGFDPFPVSAISGTGTGDLLDAVCAGLAPLDEGLETEDLDEDAHKVLGIAIVGRPNVGKSSILNALVGKERSIVSAVSGTTRDAVDTRFVGPDGKEFCLIDTAGIRRRGKVASANSKTEALSVNRAFRAIRRADVVALVLDAMQCVTEQDFRLGERIEQEGKACVIVVNKWDTIPEKDSNTTVQYEMDVRERLRSLAWAPIVYTSATTKQRIPKILAEATRVGDERAKRLSTAVLNQVVQEAMAFQQPPLGKAGKQGRIYYATQAATRPPTFVFFVNDAVLFPMVYRRYMEKQIRSNVGFPGTPIRLLWRSKKKSPKRESSGSSQGKDGGSKQTLVGSTR